MFIQAFSCGPLETNAILIGCDLTKRAAIVDPSPGSAHPLLQEVKNRSFLVEKILLTHSHWDHIADAHLLKEATGAKVLIHPLDAPNLINPGSDRLPLFIPIQGVQPDELFNDGQILTLGHLQIKVIHTPGHSPGSVCFYFESENLLISGDTLFRGGIGRLDLPTGQPQLMRPSLNKLYNLPPHTRVIPGHGGETTIAKERGKL